MKTELRLSPYLSYSQYIAYNTGQYVKRYIYEEKLEGIYLEFGKDVATKLQVGFDTFGIKDIPKEREKKLECVYQEIPLLGYADGFSQEKDCIIIDEYKTSVNKWTQAMTDKTEQLTFYAIMSMVMFKVPLDKIRLRLYWLETYKDFDGSINLSGKVVKFETKRTTSDVIKIYPKMKKAWVGIADLCKAHLN